MNTLNIDLRQPQALTAQDCTQCGGRMRLVGIEPHLTRARTDLRTYQCVVCEDVHAIEVPVVS